MSNLSVTLIHDAPACQWHADKSWDEEPCETLPAGTPCRYVAHVYGGMVHVELPDGRQRVIHPHTTKELS